jgi:hypothetical protein
MGMADRADGMTRARRYLQLAEEAARNCRSFNRPELRDVCLDIARSWVQLAVQSCPTAPLGKIAWLVKNRQPA